MLILAALKDSGIDPRIATVVHNLFAKFDLSSRAIHSLLIALGCNVPVVMVLRTAIDEVKRLKIMLIASFDPIKLSL